MNSFSTTGPTLEDDAVQHIASSADAAGFPWAQAHVVAHAMLLDEMLAMEHDAGLVSLNIKRKGDGWLVTVKVQWKGRNVVGFMHGESMWDALGRAVYEIRSRNMKWHDAKY